MRIVVPVSDVMFLVRLVDRNLAMFGLPVTYVFTGSPERTARIRAVVGATRLSASHALEDWPVHWECQLRDANRAGDVWMLESDLFFESRRWLEQLVAAQPDHEVVGAYTRRGGFAPHCLWLRQGVLARHPDCSIMPQVVDGVRYDMMDFMTRRMAQGGERCLHLPPVDMHHVSGVSVGRQELGRWSTTLRNIASQYDSRTIRYVAESIKRYLAMLERWGQDDDFVPPPAHLRAIMQAIAARGIDVDDMDECLRAVQPLEALFPPRGRGGARSD